MVVMSQNGESKNNFTAIIDVTIFQGKMACYIAEYDVIMMQ